MARNRRDAEVVVIDPRRTETAVAASRHLAIAPKSDLALFYGVAALLIERDAVDRAFVEAHTSGFDDFADHVLRPHVMEDALTIFGSAWDWDETSRLIYTIADFSLPSYEPRLWTIDLANGDLLFYDHVTHGSGGQDPNDASMVAQMSNTNGSHMSSVGLMRTAETYYGSKGYSMRLDGLEAGFNDAVRPRAIVFHEATYATDAFVAQNGYLGRSWGCPAVDPAINADLIDTIKDGTLYLSYLDQSGWLNDSGYL